jgi:putative endonuclease
VRAGWNELDLVVRRGSQLVFCEVKMKSGDAYGDPAGMVGAEKERRLRRVAQAWLASRPELATLEISFDVVAVHSGRIERLRNVF